MIHPIKTRMQTQTEKRLLKRLTGLSRSALIKTRELLGAQPTENSVEEAPSGAADSGQPSRKRGKSRAGKGRRGPLIVPHGEHSVTRKSIGRSALKVLDKLHESGHAAFLVGGGVRDALVGLKPKDFDVATDASPETIRALFRNSRIIGRRFRLVHVVYGREIIEVATFRAAHSKGEGGEIGKAGRIVRDNVFGSIEEDAYRRDFSVNALYYNIADGSVVDYVHGLADLRSGIFRLIGEPVTRCEEDPVRVLRAVRLAAKLKFDIDDSTLAAMRQISVELKSTPPPRLFEEVLKLFQGGYALRSFHSVREHDLLRYLFPLLDKRLKAGDENLVSMLDAALANTDRRVAQGKPITPAYLLAFMLWPDVQEAARRDCESGMRINDALFAAADSVLSTQLRVISIPRRFSGPMKEIWQMQPRLERLRGGRALKLMDDRRFRAAYDFLCLRSSVDERLQASAKWWTRVQNLSEEEQIEAAANRPVAEGIWPDSRGRSGVSEGDFDDEGDVGDSSQSSGNAGASAVETAGAAAKKPPRKRRRRRRKPGGDKGSAGPSSPPAS